MAPLSSPVVGARVRAPGDACHTPYGSIETLPGHSPVAIVLFDCGCRGYVPLRRLEPENQTPVRCGRLGCRRPEWPLGSGTCQNHKTAAVVVPAAQEPPFDSEARPGHAGTSALQPREGRAAIDGRGTKGAEAPLQPGEQAARQGQHAAGRKAGRGSGVPRPAAAGGRRAPVPSGKATAGSAARSEPPAAPVVQSAPAVVRKPKRPRDWWTRSRVVNAFTRYAREEGRSPSTDILGSKARRPSYCPSTSTVVKLFGSHPAALEAAGLPPNPVGRPPRKALLEAA